MFTKPIKISKSSPNLSWFLLIFFIHNIYLVKLVLSITVYYIFYICYVNIILYVAIASNQKHIESIYSCMCNTILNIKLTNCIICDYQTKHYTNNGKFIKSFRSQCYDNAINLVKAHINHLKFHKYFPIKQACFIASGYMKTKSLTFPWKTLWGKWNIGQK